MTSSVFAQETSKTYCMSGVEYTGSLDGLKIELLTAAKREAVRELFGEFISSFTKVENLRITEDTIKARSLGFIRVKGDPEYYNGKNLGEVCVKIDAYVTEEDFVKFEPLTLTQKSCTMEGDVRTIKQQTEEKAIFEALINYDRRLQSYPQEYVLPFLREVTFLEEGFVPETQVYCVSVQGFIYPIEVLETLVEPAFDANRGLVAYYPFNRNANDESGNGNHGTVHNATLADDRFGNAGSAYRFNGRDSFIEVADAPGLDLTKEVTISVWLYFEGATPAGDPIVEKPRRSWGQYALWITEDKAEFGIYPASGDKLQWLTSKQSLIQNEWNHLAGTYDGKRLSLYINGKADNVMPYASSISTSDEPL